MQPSLNCPLVAALHRGEHLERCESVIQVGHPGTGKTHLTTSLRVAACAAGKKVRFWKVTELVTMLMEDREVCLLLRVKKQLTRLDLLILDELGYVPASMLGAKRPSALIGTGYERTGVVATMNL